MSKKIQQPQQLSTDPVHAAPADHPGPATLPEITFAQSPKAAERPTKARVLVDVTVDGTFYSSGSLLQADADVIAGLANQVDTHPEAVAFAEGLVTP